MEVIGVILLSFGVCGITLVIGLVFSNLIMFMREEDKSKIAEKSKNLGLAAKVLCDKPQSKVLTNTYDVWKNHNNQELFDTGKIPPRVGLKLNTAPPNKGISCANSETPPDNKTRVVLRKKRKSKK